MTTTTSFESVTKNSLDNMNIRVYNTLTRNKEPFQTVETGKVGMYLCGPTVYREAHIGHMVGPVIFDCVKRYLTYCGFDVTWVVNIKIGRAHV
jgi:cysteinyl-tRNA synthetase